MFLVTSAFYAIFLFWKTFIGTMMRKIINIGLCMTLLTGCGAEIAYKQGATAQDLQAGKNACLKAGDESALEKCMAENGWTLQKLDGSSFSDEELFATVTVSEDNRMAAPPTAENKKPLQTTESIATEKAIISDNQTKEDLLIKEDKQANPSTTSKTNATPIPAPKPNLLDTYVIKSWWKMGGSATLLEQNMLTCSEKLGSEHTPDKKTFTFTRGFAICMREAGWRGLIEKN
jgi:hypothetical protein